MIRILDCNIQDAWYANCIGEYFMVTNIDDTYYTVRAKDGYLNIVLLIDGEYIGD